MQTQDQKRAPRMSLGAITKGRVRTPQRVVMYGTEGVGKSTWAADAPAPLFLPTEDGSEHLDVSRLPRARSWGDVVDALRVLRDEPHHFKTLVTDTLDSLEPLVWDRVCSVRMTDSGKRVTNIEEYGFARGYIYALDVWREFLDKLDDLVREREMNVILIAHSALVTIKSPDTEDFQRFDLKLHHKTSALVREWASHVLFATTETAMRKVNNRTKIVGLGDRVVHTANAPGWVAKTRSGAPPVLPLSWDAWVDALDGKSGSADEVLARISEMLVRVPEPKRGVVEQAIASAKASADPLAALQKIENRLNVTLAASAKETA